MLRYLVNGFFIYLIVWWTVLFAVLPLGSKTYAEAGIEVTDGGDPGAPIDPKLKQKAWTTTWVSAVLFAIGYAVYALHLIHLPDIPAN
jgi:predicted secreted protein